MLAFSGTRTYHRMTCAIEDAGFEIRDCIFWCYGSGFPKAGNLAKQIDKKLGVKGTYGGPKSKAAEAFIDGKKLRLNEDSKRNDGWKRPWMEDPEAVDRNARVYIPGSKDAEEWNGWASALRPAVEPIAVARKPYEGTLAENVLVHGTGVMNIDESRIKDEEYQKSEKPYALRIKAGFEEARAKKVLANQWKHKSKKSALEIDPIGLEVINPKDGNRVYGMGPGMNNHPLGRWPSNFITDASAEVVDTFKAFGGTADALRFFFHVKASQKDRGRGNIHATVKPTKLMQYLIRMVTPKGGVVLDPFMGSGSTGKAALVMGYRFVGIELNYDHWVICNKRLKVMGSA